MTAPSWVVELESGVWVAPGSPGRTLVLANAARFATEAGAYRALNRARKYRPFAAAVVMESP